MLEDTVLSRNVYWLSRGNGELESNNSTCYTPASITCVVKILPTMEGFMRMEVMLENVCLLV
ncbi:hypothetical protein BDV59DRAFT_183833 [Aspergillus ambiguus]|uniref:uncharacterized protein n=1 Tax=Aspergillus ambiguus TaxID=176160 RepID=UPI003CCD8B7D